MDSESKIKLFGLSATLTERDLDSTEKKFQIDLQRNQTEEKDESYYPQFDRSLRQEAKKMSQHYELFYCLENNIRKLIAETLSAKHGGNWWEKCVSIEIKKNAKDNIKKELDAGFTLRSEEDIDYITFGELAEIVKTNWESFGALFSSDKAFAKVMSSLNILRGPIAHCSPLSEDEIIRLNLTLRDWFRLME